MRPKTVMPLVAGVFVLLALKPLTARGDVEPDIEKRTVKWRIAATSYYMFNAHRVSGPYNDLGYPYADSHGFGLVFVNGGVRFEASRWGILVDLKWGPNVDRLTEITPVSRGFARWIPVGKDRLKLDFGYFGAFIGIETDDEWMNPTFTRGVIYFRMQPFRHLGLRATAAPHDDVDILVVVARGSIFGTQFPEEQRSDVTAPTVGAQIWYRPAEGLDIKLGSVASPNGTDGNRNWQAIVDFITSWSPGPGSVFVDADYQFSRNGPLTGTAVSKQWGVSLGGAYDFTDDWGIGFRSEYLGAEQGGETRYIFTFTGTVRYKPVQYLIISLEPRGELADTNIYFGRPLITDPASGETAASLNQRWFFGFWLGVTARLGN